MNIYLVGLAYFPKITYRRYQRLTAYFSGDARQVWQAEIDELAQAGLETEIAQEFIIWRESASLESFQNALEREGIYAVSLHEPDYPPLLKQIADPPHTLFVRGTLDNDQPAIGVVGTRKFSPYGKYACETITSELARQGITIISGLALGIDTIGHTAALREHGRTIAILGSGIDNRSLAPPSNRSLAERIIAGGGAIVSEYPPGFKPTKYSFPARNRIIAGLTLGTLVIEAPVKSGALITAEFSLDYNRELFAVPHPITSASGVGTNNLLKKGAHMVTSAEDVMNVLQLQTLLPIAPKRNTPPANPLESRLLGLLQSAMPIDEIIKAAATDSAAVNSTLALMELKGMIKNLGNMSYIVKS